MIFIRRQILIKRSTLIIAGSMSTGDSEQEQSPSKHVVMILLMVKRSYESHSTACVLL